MKRLFILRHAKAAPGDPRSDDHERALNARGRGDASLMGAAMHSRRYVPDLALSSTSKRTVETWERVAPEFDAPPKVRFLPLLYLAADRTILKLVQASGDDVGALLVLGHNPGLEECAKLLARKSDARAERLMLDRMREKFPTCALAVFDFDISRWQDVDPETGALVDFIRPKDLKGE